MGLNSFIGQERIKHNLGVYIYSAKKRDESLDHILLCGPQGVGKETLARAIAGDMGVDIKVINGSDIEKPIELSAMLTKLEKGDILFIDEIHRLNRNAEKILYPAMEDFTLDMVTGAGAMASSLRMQLKHFTLIGATTSEVLVSTHLRERFDIKFRLNPYSIDEMAQFIKMFAKDLKIKIEDDAVIKIAKASNGVPLEAKNLLKRAQDFAVFNNSSIISENIANKAVLYTTFEDACDI